MKGLEIAIVLLVLGLAVIVYGLVWWPRNGAQEDETHDSGCG